MSAKHTKHEDSKKINKLKSYSPARSLLLERKMRTPENKYRIGH